MWSSWAPEFSLKREGLDDADNNQSFPITKFIAGLVPPDVTFGATPQDCGNIDHDGFGDGGEIAIAGDACAILSLEFSGIYLGELGFFAPDIFDPSGWETTVPPNLLDKIATEALNWAFLLQILPELLDNLALALDGAAQGVSIPFIGDALVLSQPLI